MADPVGGGAASESNGGVATAGMQGTQGSSASASSTPPGANAGPAMPDSQAAAIGVVDQPCAPEGKRACTGHGTLDKLICMTGRWSRAGYCDGNNRCDTTAGVTEGSCQPIAAVCIDAEAGALVCDGRARKRCEADLLRAVSEECPANSHCVDNSPVQCICDDGYQDRSGFCTAMVRCPAGACAPGGRCKVGETDYSCVCDDGYEGTGTKACISSAEACAQVLKCPSEYPCTGTPGDYTCRGQFADWPMPDLSEDAPVAPKYTVSSDGQTILDEVTKLVWQARVPEFIPGCTDDSRASQGYNTCASIAEAMSYCDGLRLGGLDDWRAPTKIEMESLMDLDRPLQSGIDVFLFPFPRVFGLGKQEAYFTSSPHRGPSGGIWMVRGAEVYNAQASGRVCCVRGP